MIADFCEEPGTDPVGVALAFARSMSASERPAPNAPIFRKDRRFKPSQ